MCGICGSWGMITNEDDIQSAMFTLRHRGDDDRSYWMSGNRKVALGHQRLAIIDLSENGRQPMSNEDGSAHLVVNGEIYNHTELRSRLGSHKFKSNSDSEVILHLYEDAGVECIKMLRGMFSLALYDSNCNRLLLARDPMGKKPLYYWRDGDKLAFASEIKALFELRVPRRVNYEAISSYLTYQQVLGQDTLFHGVRKLMPGHIAVINEDDMVVTRYWNIDDGMDRVGGCTLRRMADTLDESVRLRLRSDVPVGVFLSGGIDSSAVAALYRKHYSGTIHAFTVTFPEHSEAKYAKIVSQHLDAVYHEVYITADMVTDDISRVTWHHDEPLGDAATINNYYLAREAKKYVTVVLAGEGGDEVFGGYPHHHYPLYIDAMQAIPKALRRAGSCMLKQAGVGNVTSRLYGIGRILQFPCQPDKVSMLQYPTTATGRLTLDWLLCHNDNTITPDDSMAKTVSDTFDQMLALDCRNLLQKFLMKADKGTMAWAVEERLPLLDQEVVRLAFMATPAMRHDKYMLRKTVENLLPGGIVWRDKQGFGTPVDDWLASDSLKGMVRDRLSCGELLRNICKPEALQVIIDMLPRVKTGGGLAAIKPCTLVWTLFALQVWHDVWFSR